MADSKMTTYSEVSGATYWLGFVSFGLFPLPKKPPIPVPWLGEAYLIITKRGYTIHVQDFSLAIVLSVWWQVVNTWYIAVCVRLCV